MLLQKAVAPVEAPKRIISLVPSITELLYHLGLNEEVAGITKFCIRPSEWFRSKAKIGGTKNINIKKILELKPDLIIANKEENVQEQVEELAEYFNVWVTDVNTVEQAYGMIKDIGTLTDSIPAAKKITADIQKEFAKIKLAQPAIKTAYLIWRTPCMTIGGDTFISNVMQQCGLQNVFAAQTRYPKITTEDIINSGCRLVLLSTEPYPFKEKHIAEMEQLLPGIKIILADGEMFSWYGSRMLQMPQYLSGLIHSIKGG